MSSVSVVMKSGEFSEASCRTALRACKPAFCNMMPLLRGVVASTKSARSISTASTYCCHTANPREQRSIATALYCDVSSCKYRAIDLEISAKIL